jgi:hypothetical protein
VTVTATERLDRAVELLTDGAPPYTGAAPTFRKCGHPRTQINTYTNGRCVTCTRAQALEAYEPIRCPTCNEPLGSGKNADGYHRGACEPTTCTCPDGGHPNGLGECGTCHRLVLSHSWHNGRPER